jgi:hypothetical protein
MKLYWPINPSFRFCSPARQLRLYARRRTTRFSAANVVSVRGLRLLPAAAAAAFRLWTHDRRPVYEDLIDGRQ